LPAKRDDSSVQPDDSTAQPDDSASQVGESAGYVDEFERADGPENPLGIPDEQTLEDLLRHLATQDSPRVFALCAVAKGWRRAEVAAWGMSFPDQAVLYLPGERSVGYFSSAQQAAELFGMGRDIRLIWPDFVPLREMLAK
jgi:hypothetical protein